MNNPYFPKRKIKHAKLLTEAGFEIDTRWYREKDRKDPILCDVNKLIYWVNKDLDIRLTFFDDQIIALKELINFINENIKYNLKKKARVVFE